jgi:tetratricopeptide (TPR) repeat protein
MLQKEVYPHRKVVAHFLSHGVTRERLHDQIVEHGGYHVVHWSGHGHLNLLELSQPGGHKDHLSGEELLDLFTNAGGFLPRLFFLSACHSGDILPVRDWNDFIAIAQGKAPGTKAASVETKKLDLQEQPGFTGTAHALLQGGVPTVVAMRYAVGDDYARELAVEFYRALLAHAEPKTAAAALNLARKAMRDTNAYNTAQFAVCDHATPVLYGEEDPRLALAKGRSPALNPRNPRLHQINELTTASHEHFVGRTWELAGLGADVIGASRGTEVLPVAVITGLGGMGKTALVAEALALWESRFEWVLLYQAKPNPLVFDGFLRDAHLKLMGELGRYHEHVKARPADAIYRAPDEAFTGAARLERLTRNLLRALKDEPVLLVLDNFETNLKPQREGETASACQDPAWDQCLALLARELVGTASRVLITCRRPLAALANDSAYTVPLGPLPPPEAALYLKAQPALSRMVFSNNSDEQTLAIRTLNASRFHPLLMDRLARLAANITLRPQLLQALETLETTKDFAQLPALFAARSGDDTELAYLNDALAASLDQLIRDASSDARRLLWMIAVANEPVTLGLLRKVWSEESLQTQMYRRMKHDLERLHELPPDHQAYLQSLPPEIREALSALPSEPPARPEITPLLHQLVCVGLVTEERKSPDNTNPDLSCHELVRERIRAWMAQQPQDQGDLTENSIRLSYAEWLEAFFNVLQHQSMSLALQAGSRALVYCVQAEAWDRLGRFAGSVVTSTKDPRLLDGLIPHLQAAAETAPEGKSRWSCLCHLANAFHMSGRPDISLPIFEQAATLARANAEAAGDGALQAWSDLAMITGNWAIALQSTGKFDAARDRHLESAEASKRAADPAIDVIGIELEALRIDIMQGKADTALPEIESRLSQVQLWWTQHGAGQAVPEAPDTESLARAFIGALDIARNADLARCDWGSALRRIDTQLEVERALQRSEEHIGATRMNRANVLVEIPGRLGEAKAELEACLELFRNNADLISTARSSLASLFDEQGDIAQAIIQERRALALREHLPTPIDRAISHNNLSNYLNRRCSTADLIESSCHRLASLLYLLFVRHGQHLQDSLRNYAVDFRRARAAGIEFTAPRVAELLADPAFAPLDQWLQQHQIDVDELQASVDQFLDQARQLALSSENSP